MDPRRFDSLTRAFAAPRTRRSFLAGIGALVLGAYGAAARQLCPPGQTPNKKGDCSCPAGTDPCPNGCFNKKRDPNNCGACGNACPPDATCVKGECRCPAGGCAESTCVPVTPPFTKPVAPCSSDTECCDGATCCNFGAGPGCFDLRSNFSACGTTCDNTVNCLNNPDNVACVDGVCVAA